MVTRRHTNDGVQEVTDSWFVVFSLFSRCFLVVFSFCCFGGGRNAVRSTASFSSGAHSWEVHIDKCVSKNIFVGVIASGGSTENYVGSDRYGW